MSQNETIIRELLETDLNKWFALRKKLWDETPEDDHKNEMLDIIEHSDTQSVIVAENPDDGVLVGFVEVSIRPFVEDCETDNVGYLEGWFVEPDSRRKGIGMRLVAMAEEWAREHGCTEMASDAEVGNETSLSAHLIMGYEETSRLIHLRKDL